MELALPDRQSDPAGVGDTHAHTRVLHGAGQTHGVTVLHSFVVIGLHRLQRLHQSRGTVHDLTVGQDAAGTDGITVADLPRGNAHLVRHFVQQCFNAEAGLGHAEAPEGSRRGIVGIVGPAVDLIGFVLIGSRAVGAGPLQHRPA